MIHQMNLCENPFAAIRDGSKTVEMRLNDEKRRKISIGDYIEFIRIQTKEKLLCEVTGLCVFRDFHELYSHYEKQSIGYSDEEKADPNDMLIYYSQEAIERYGVLAIEIQKIKA